MSYGGAMVLPRNYVVMDQEEMTYLEGGGSYQFVGALNLTASVCGVIASMLAISTAASQFLHLVPGVGTVPAIAIGAGLGCLAGYFDLASKLNGMTLYVYKNIVAPWNPLLIPIVKW